jgi:hypothetical protein
VPRHSCPSEASAKEAPAAESWLSEAKPEYVGFAYVKGAAAPRRPAACPACAGRTRT